MSKRKRQKYGHSNHSNGRELKRRDTSIHLCSVERGFFAHLKTTSLFQRSVSLEGIEINSLKNKEKNVVQLRSPTASDTQQGTSGRKRKRSLSYNSVHDTKHELDNKRPETLQQTPENIKLDMRNPIAYWALTQNWPPNFGEQDSNMKTVSVNNRKSESTRTHPSDRLTRMQEHHIFMKASALMKLASKNLCTELLGGDREPIGFPVFPAARVLDVLAQVENANEGRIQRDVLPCVVPSAENLRFWGVLGLESIAEEISALWTRCATMGSTIPKPVYVAGLSQEAFSSDELDSLRNYTTFTTPFMFTPHLCFPFLICETKSGDEGMNEGHRQNLHSAAIAVRAIFELYWAAYGKSDRRVKELYGQVLVFTIAHNHEIVYIYGHFAVLSAETPETLAFHRCQITVLSLTALDGKDLNKPQNFVRNVYDKFAPEHLKRIKEAAKKLPSPDPRTGASFAASGLSLRDTQSQQGFQETQSQNDGSS